ncbi:hypothetical protein EE612_033788 [Oryza sativa]|nr:hypothetical protein EE612_033788 [Oryza sativa]
MRLCSKLAALLRRSRGPAAGARVHRRERAGGAHGGGLRGARRAQARALRGLPRQRHRRGGAAHHHHRRRELPGLPRRHPRRRPHGPLPRPVRALRDQDPHRDRHRRRPLVPPLPRRLRRHRRARRRGRRGHGRRRAPPPFRRLRRILEPRHLRLRRLRRRRAHLPEQAHCRRRRRGLRHGGGQLPHQVRLPRLHHPPPQRLPRVQDHAGPGPLQPQDPGRLGLRGRRGVRRRRRRSVGRRQGQERGERRGLRPPGRRALLRHWTRAGDKVSRRAARAGLRWLCRDQARLHSHQRQGSLRRR